ncbi:MAG: hypothetical protein FJ395_12045 [Verrucomicrobia bacterium]|nr:hypothetical protein [Verrucomicrobiota bacterium]
MKHWAKPMHIAGGSSACLLPGAFATAVGGRCSVSALIALTVVMGLTALAPPSAGASTSPLRLALSEDFLIPTEKIPHLVLPEYTFPNALTNVVDVMNPKDHGIHKIEVANTGNDFNFNWLSYGNAINGAGKEQTFTIPDSEKSRFLSHTHSIPNKINQENDNSGNSR